MGNGPRDATPIPEGLRAMVPGTPSQPQSKEGAQKGLSCEKVYTAGAPCLRTNPTVGSEADPAQPGPSPLSQRYSGG